MSSGNETRKSGRWRPLNAVSICALHHGLGNAHVLVHCPSFEPLSKAVIRSAARSGTGAALSLAAFPAASSLLEHHK